MLSQIDQIFLQILKEYLHNEAEASKIKRETKLTTTPDAEMISQVLQKAHKNTIYPMVYQVVMQHTYLACFSEEEQQQLKQKMRYEVMQSTYHSERFLHIYRKLQEAGLHPLIIKGAVCKSLYPDPEFRPSKDEDLLLTAEELKACNEVMLQNGFVTDWKEGEGTEGLHEVKYVHPETRLYLEVHLSLFSLSDAFGRKLNSYFSDSIRRATTVLVEGCEVWTLAPTDHVLYLLLHFYKHFINQGMGIRQVIDIILFCNRYEQQIAWDELNEKLEELHLQGLFAVIMQMGERYLGISSKRASEKFQGYYQEDITDFITELLDGGIYGRMDLTRKHSAALTRTKVQAQYGENAKRGRWKMREVLFPEKQVMEREYPWAKHSVLLPAAWGCRIAKETFRIVRSKKEKQAGTLEEYREREKLFIKYGILP